MKGKLKFVRTERIRYSVRCKELISATFDFSYFPMNCSTNGIYLLDWWICRHFPPNKPVFINLKWLPESLSKRTYINLSWTLGYTSAVERSIKREKRSFERFMRFMMEREIIRPDDIKTFQWNIIRTKHMWTKYQFNTLDGFFFLLCRETFPRMNAVNVIEILSVLTGWGFSIYFSKSKTVIKKVGSKMTKLFHQIAMRFSTIKFNMCNGKWIWRLYQNEYSDSLTYNMITICLRVTWLENTIQIIFTCFSFWKYMILMFNYRQSVRK